MKKIYATALLLALSWPAQATLIDHVLTFAETQPGSGGPFFGSFAVDDSLLQPNTTIKFSELQQLEFNLYDNPYHFLHFGDPDNRGFRTDGFGALQPIITDLTGTISFNAQFTNTDSNVSLSDGDWEFGRPIDTALCSGGNTQCAGTYDISVGILGIPTGADVYDEIIIDGTLREQSGNPVIPPLSFETTFLNVPTPVSDGVLRITASGDFDHPAEELAVFVDGFFIGNLFGDTALDIELTESIAIAQPFLASLTSDSMVDLLLLGSSGTTNNVNRLTVQSARLIFAIEETTTSIPEPATPALFGLALLGLGMARQRAKDSAKSAPIIFHQEHSK